MGGPRSPQYPTHQTGCDEPCGGSVTEWGVVPFTNLAELGWDSQARSPSVFLWLTDSGISLENGVYAAAVVPGSPAAKEGSLAVGDRIVAVSLQNRANCPLHIDIALCDHSKKQKSQKAFS